MDRSVDNEVAEYYTIAFSAGSMSYSFCMMPKCNFRHRFTLAGFLFLVEGLFFVWVATGISQQDPTLQEFEELKIKFERSVSETQRLKKELEGARLEIGKLREEIRGLQQDQRTAKTPAGVVDEKYTAAVARLTNEIAGNSTDPDLYRTRGIAYRHLRSFPEAIADFDKAIELRSADARVYNERGTVYYQLRDLDRADKDFTTAIVRDPTLAEAYNNRGFVARLRGDYSGALKDFSTAQELGIRQATKLLSLIKAEVTTAQLGLQRAGWNPGPVDGIPGPQTVRAVREFQKTRGLPITGLLDGRTRKALLQAPGSRAGGDSSPPRLLSRPKLEYPPLARERRWEGTVKLRIELLDSGTVGRVTLAKSSGYEILDAAAQRHVKQWRHDPARHNGAKVTKWVTLDIDFNLERESPRR